MQVICEVDDRIRRQKRGDCELWFIRHGTAGMVPGTDRTVSRNDSSALKKQEG